MFSTAFKRTAFAFAKQEVRSLSSAVVGRTAAKTVAMPSMATKSFACQACSFSSMHVCGPNCAHHAMKATGVRQMSTMDTSSPDAVIEALEAGNARFVSGEVEAPNRDMDRLKELEGGQAPFAAFLSCADSRVPVEMVFDQGFGDLFICRIAGNIVNTETIGSLEFGCAVLGAKVLYVMGHSSCGAVNATIAGADVPGVISSLYYNIKPACESGDLDTSIAENVKVQVKALETSPVLKGLVEEGKLKIIGGVYDLASGKANRVC